MNMKVGLIRCLQTEDMCPATTDFKVMKEKECAFKVLALHVLIKKRLGNPLRGS